MSGTKRICVICRTDKQSGEIYAFDELLRDLGRQGRYAHPVCVMEAQRALRGAISRRGGRQHVD